MHPLISMMNKLAPLGIYDLSDNTNIKNELQAYGYALNVHRQNMEELLRESFISTAESYGLENREKVIGDTKSSYSTEKRREMLTLRKGFNENDFTKASLIKFLQSLGVTSYSFTEQPGAQSVSVCIGGSYPDSEAKWIENQIREFLPAHLNIFVYHGGKTWNQRQLMNKTFAELDAENLSWARIHLQ